MFSALERLKTTRQEESSMSKKHIEECIRTSLEGYFKDLRGTEPDGMYDMMVVEKPCWKW